MTDDMIKIDGAEEIAAALADLSANVEADLADQLGDHASTERARVRARGQAAGGVAKLASKSVTGRKDPRGGTIDAGGSKRLPNGTGTYGDIFFGAEFGGGSRPATRQFRPYRARGYWFFNQLDKDDEQLDERLADSITDRLDS